LLEVGDDDGRGLFVTEGLVELAPAAVGAAPSEPAGGAVAAGAPPVVFASGEGSEVGATGIPDVDVLAGTGASPPTPLVFVDPSPGATVEFEAVAFDSAGLTCRMKTRDALPTAAK
jgi:hypothetical protein